MKKVVWRQVEVEHGPFYNVNSIAGVVVGVTPAKVSESLNA